MTIVSKLEHGDLDAHRCLALPSSLEVFALNASSPNSASISSTTSSSMAELFGSPGLGNEDGGDSTSAVSTTAGRSDSERPLDCGHISSASNIPSPIIEEGPSMSTNEDDVDHVSEDIDLDVKPSFDEACFSDACCRQDSSSDDMFMSRLDELLQSDTRQEFAAESGLACVDDLFPSSSNMGQDFSLLDGMSTWSMESLQSLEALPFPDEEIVQAESASFGGEESALQMFTQWLRNNAHWISLSDLRKIKLKTTTIENATRRLGGGKKGLMLFLKFVLMWVQNSQLKRAVMAEAMPANRAFSSVMQSSPAAGLRGTSEMSMEGIPMRDGLNALESPCAIQSSRVHTHSQSGCSSPLPHMTIKSSCPDWTTRARWTHTPAVEHNVAIPTPNGFLPTTSGRSPLPSTAFGHSNRAWPLHSNMLRGVALPSMLPSLRSPANTCIGGGGFGDPANMMMLMQQECSEANPAATKRAARKSRMERQRWSVRRNRKWSTAAHQSQQHLAAKASNGDVHATLPARSQVIGSPPPNFPFSSSRAYQQRPSSRSAVMECQQNKKPERNSRLLFHKQLKQSDVGNLGRIVLPKAAETCLPPLDLRDGMNLIVEDMNSAKVWNMRYRFWPNNKSRMYLLENTGDFVKSYDLKEGDYMMLFRDNMTSRFVIKGAKGPTQAAMLSGAAAIEDISDAGGVGNGGKKRKSVSKEADLVLMGSTNSEESCDDSLLAELIEQSLEDFKESSETEMCDPLKPI